MYMYVYVYMYMYVCIYIYIYICIYIYIYIRRRSAAIAHNQISLESVIKMYQMLSICNATHVKCGNMCALKTTYDKCIEFMTLL